MFYIHEVTLTGLTVLYFIVELFNNSSKGWGQSYLCLVSTSLSLALWFRESRGWNGILITLRLLAPWLIIL